MGRYQLAAFCIPIYNICAMRYIFTSPHPIFPLGGFYPEYRLWALRTIKCFKFEIEGFYLYIYFRTAREIAQLYLHKSPDAIRHLRDVSAVDFLATSKVTIDKIV